LPLEPAAGPLDAVVTVPGSKSIANRALVCAALADGESRLRGLPGGDDTGAMIACLRGLGIGLTLDGDLAVVAGTGGDLAGGPVELHAGLAGTTSRFVTALAALAAGPVTIDGAPPLRRRPMGPLHDALAELGATVRAVDRAGHLPVTVSGPLTTGGTVTLPGDVSSQYLTALMLVGPLLAGGLRLHLSTALVSVPYIELTAAVMASFGVNGVRVGADEIVVPPGRYRGTELTVEPDASSASYPLAMAAVAGGRVQIAGLHRDSAQGDAVFADLLARMGCTVADDGAGLVVERDPAVPLQGIDVDMADVSDLVPTLAAVAVTAASPTTITGVGFIRAKESDRLGDLGAELARTGARVTVQPEGLRIEPSPSLHGARLATHHDHRLAMAFGVLGTAVPGIEVADPAVVAKSWPAFWAERAALLRSSAAPGPVVPGPHAIVAAFDVDGTVTTGDCVVPFVRRVAGTVPMLARLIRRAPRLVPALARRDRDAVKAVLAAAAFTGMPITAVEATASAFAAEIERDRLRRDTLARLRWHRRAGHEVVFVSASFGVYLRPLAERLGVGGVVGTELAVDGCGRCTGALDGPNCRGTEKVARFHAWLDEHHGGRSAVEVWAYGDSPDDRPLLADADHAVWAEGPLAAVP
jgi:3-phosphoshikimate 1-carboxyvinyltransferase